MYRWQMLVAAATAFGGIALVNVVGARTGSDQNLELTASRAMSHGYEHYRFEITGSSAKPLYPGAVRRIDLTFSNPYPAPIRVQAVSGKLISTSKNGCLPSPINLQVRPYRGHLPITVYPKMRRAAGYIELHMPNSVVNACQGVTFTIKFIGEATKAGR